MARQDSASAADRNRHREGRPDVGRGLPGGDTWRYSPWTIVVYLASIPRMFEHVDNRAGDRSP
jgi:hypothetical protein